MRKFNANDDRYINITVHKKDDQIVISINDDYVSDGMTICLDLSEAESFNQELLDQIKQ